MSLGSFCRSPSDVTMMPAARVGEPGGERRGLAEVAPEANDPQVRVAGLQLAQDVEALVACCRRR